MYRHEERTVLNTADRLEQALEEARATGLEVAMRGGTGGPLNTFLGTDELRGMGQHLLDHMRDEERWGEPNNNFEPIDFVTAAYEVAHDHTAGEPGATKSPVNERLPLKLTFNIFIDFWLPRIAQVTYGEEYAGKVTSILEESSR